MPEPHDFLPLKLHVFEILLTLAEGERHGYAIVKEVEETAGRRLEAGNLYRTLRTLLARGLIAEAPERPDPALDDQRRRYFRLTDLGRRVARAEAGRLEGLVAAARTRRLLGGAPGAAGGSR